MDRSFVRRLTEECKTHGDWLEVVEFGLHSLLYPPKNQDFLLEILLSELRREMQRDPLHTEVEHLQRILDELGLRFTT
jgi:hypothetical protein